MMVMAGWNGISGELKDFPAASLPGGGGGR
jgi:hypothetical protein